MINFDKLKELRKERKLNLSAMAESVGIAIGFYSEVESGKKKVSLKTIIAMANVLGVTVNDLLTDCGRKPQISGVCDLKELPSLIAWLTRWAADMAAQVDEGHEVADIIVDFGDASRWSEETVRLKKYLKSGIPYLERLVELMREVPEKTDTESVA
jgi:transcriptional regulator with XRE-family HTH domain